MSNSLSDQLLKAGLITQDQIDKSEQDRQQRKTRARTKAADGKNTGKPAKGTPPKPAAQKKPAKKNNSDLAKFYQQRNQLERTERETEERLKREAAARRKKVRKQLRELIAANAQNTEDASIRFNFVVGETVKYLYVTEEQQNAIAAGELSITFMDGKRCLVTPEIGEQIRALDDSKIVINFKDDDHPSQDAATQESDIPATASQTNEATESESSQQHQPPA